MPAWLITGCSTGFGRELARAVLARSWNAVVTARNPASVSDIVAGQAANAVSLPLDVTAAAQIDNAIRMTEARFGAIDVLVNNAGDFAHCMRDLADTHYPDADLIRVVMDNLSTHSTGALYETFPAPEAHRILQRLEFHYTPKHASWLKHGGN